LGEIRLGEMGLGEMGQNHIHLPLTLTLNLSRVTNLRLVFLLHFNYLYYGPIVLGCPSDRPLQPYM